MLTHSLKLDLHFQFFQELSKAKQFQFVITCFLLQMLSHHSHSIRQLCPNSTNISSHLIPSSFPFLLELEMLPHLILLHLSVQLQVFLSYYHVTIMNSVLFCFILILCFHISFYISFSQTNGNVSLFVNVSHFLDLME